MPQSQPISTSFNASIKSINIYRALPPIDAANIDVKAQNNFRTFAPKPLSSLTQDVAPGGWQDLLNVVNAKVTLTSGDRLVTSVAKDAPDLERQVRAGVMACLTALDELQSKLTSEHALRQQLERLHAERRREFRNGYRTENGDCAHCWLFSDREQAWHASC